MFSTAVLEQLSENQYVALTIAPPAPSRMQKVFISTFFISLQQWVCRCYGNLSLFKVKCLPHSAEYFWLHRWILCHSGPMRAYVLAREDAIHRWRELMGPTKVFRARYTSPASIRAQFGLTDTRNTTHGSGRMCVECHAVMQAHVYTHAKTYGLLNDSLSFNHV